MGARILAYLHARSTPTLVAIALGLVVLVWVVDFVSGPELSSSILYLLPVTFAAWLVGPTAGFALAAVSTVAWFLTDIATYPLYSHPLIPYWNAAVRLAFFSIVTHALTSLHVARQRQEDLIAYIVHDLRSPLGNFLLGLELLQENAAESPDGLEKEVIDTSVASVNRALALIDSLLDLSRLEAGRMPVEQETVEPVALYELAKDQVTFLAGQRQVSLALEAEPDLPPVLADRTMSERVLINLLSNAIRFSPDGSTVTVRLTARLPGQVTMRVADEGPGIPVEWHSRVFDKFGQVQARNAGISAGSGLGLTFCKLAVEAQGGRIWLESHSGEGTTVAFSLPAARRPIHLHEERD